MDIARRWSIGGGTTTTTPPQVLLNFSQRFRLTTFPFHAGEIATSFIAYNGILHVVGPALSKTVARRQYESLSDRTKINWNIRIVSFTQATFICTMALRVILSDLPGRRLMSRDDRLWGYTSAAGRVQACALGYFLYDTLISVQYYDILGPSSLAHGICASLITILGFKPFANYYGVNFVLYELSTPFLNIHWMLDKLNMTGTKIQLYNGIALMASFFGCRLAWGSYQTWLLSRDILSAWREHLDGRPFVMPPSSVVLEEGVLKTAGSSDVIEFPRTLLATYLIANTLLSGLNFYWFGQMVKAMRRRFRTEDHDGSTTTNNTKGEKEKKRRGKK